MVFQGDDLGVLELEKGAHIGGPLAAAPMTAMSPCRWGD